MEYFREFDLKTQKQHSNRWMARPPGMEGVELVKDPGAFIPTGEETPGNALQIVGKETESQKEADRRGNGRRNGSQGRIESDLSAQTTSRIR